MVVILDITEREERENLRREFTANVSHELKTPLTSISGFAEIMQNGMVKPADVPRFAGNIYTESQRLISLVDDIMRLSRLDEEDVQLPSEDLDLLALAQDVARRLEPAAKEQGLTMAVQGSGSIRGVRSIVDEMVYNLCDNAVKYNRKGGSVTITVTEGPREVSLSVADTGIGIPRGGPGAGVRALLPGGQEPLEGDRRHGAGAVHRQARGGLPQRPGAPGEPGGQGHHGDPHLPPQIPRIKDRV